MQVCLRMRTFFRTMAKSIAFPEKKGFERKLMPLS